MHPPRCRVLLALLLLAVLPFVARAQDRHHEGALVGVGIEAGRRFELGNLPVYPGSAECGIYDGGTTDIVGLEARLLFPSLFAPGSGAMIGLAARRESITAETEAIDPIVLAGETAGTVVTAAHNYRLEGKATAIELSLAWRGAISGRFGGWGGVAITSRFGSPPDAVDVIDPASGLQFAGGLDQRKLTGGARQELAPFGVGLLAGVDHLLPLSDRFTMRFSVHGAFEASGALEGWTGASLVGGVSLLLDLASDENDDTSTAPVAPMASTPPAQVEPRQEPTRSPSRLTTSLDLYGLDAADRRQSAATVLLFETLVERHRPIAGRYSLDALDELLADSGDTSNDPLAEVARRLARAPGTILALQPVGAPGASQRTAEARGRDLEQRLLGAGAPAEAIRIVPTETDRQERSGAVAMQPSAPWLLREVVSLDRRHEVEPPLLGIDPSYDSPAGIRSWKIEIAHDERVVARYGSASQEIEGEEEIGWEIDPARFAAKRSTLVATLTVEDSAGSIAQVSAPTPLILERHVRAARITYDATGRPREVTASLFPFETGAAALSSRNRAAIAELIAALPDLRRIRVVADEDRGMGRRLTAERREAVVKEVRAELARRNARGVQVEAATAPTHRIIDGEIPEGGVASYEIVLELEGVGR